MKRIVYASVLALSLLSLLTPHPTSARIGGPSADGNLKFSSDDGLTKHIEFNAATDGDGNTTGQITFSGEVEIPDQDVDGAGDKDFSGSLSNLYIEAKFDCLSVSGNRAAMSGAVTGSNVGEYIGRTVLLVVEDNGAGVEGKAPDTLTWGLYKLAAKGWVPSDAEREDDNGADLEWTATDAERKDDVGVSSKKSELVTCKSFPLSSYSFVDVKDGDGEINVRP